MNIAGLPTAFEFQLPRGWEPVDTGDSAPDGTFVALNVDTAPSGFTANITLEGVSRPDLDTLPEIAGGSVDVLRVRSPDVTVLSSGELDDPAAPGYAQQLRMTAEVNGRTWDVVQAQVYISSHAEGGEREQTVVRAALTCTVDQFAAVVRDFDEFLLTLRFASEEGA